MKNEFTHEILLVVRRKMWYSSRVSTKIQYFSQKGDCMNFLLDLGVILLFVLFIYSGIKRGIVFTAINIGGTIGAVVLSSFVASLVALPIYNGMIRQNVVNTFTEATKGIEKSDPVKAAQSVLDSLSNFTLNTFSLTGIDTAALTKSIQKTNLNLPEMLEGMVRPTAVKMVSIVLTIILFLICMMIVNFLARKFTKAINRTMLGVPNRVLGGIVGAAEALLIIMVISMIIHFVMMFLEPEACTSLNNDINKTWFYQYIYRISIPDLIISQLTLK